MIDDLMEFITIDANGQIGPREEVNFANWTKNHIERCASDAALLGKSIDSDVSVSLGTSVRMDDRLAVRQRGGKKEWDLACLSKKNIVDIHEWHIEVFPEPPNGTTLEIVIPNTEQ